MAICPRTECRSKRHQSSGGGRIFCQKYLCGKLALRFEL